MHFEHTYALLILVTGSVIICTMLLKAGLKPLHIPALVGYLLMGFVLRLLDGQWGFLSNEADIVFRFLSHVGVAALLFRIGLESNLHNLVHQLPKAGWIWLGNVALSGLAGYAAARQLLNLDLMPSLFAAVALTATSVGVSMAVWQNKRALQTSNGALLIDVAELDDISGVGLMAILFALVPVLRKESGHSLPGTSILQTGGIFLLKLILFTTGCVLFSRYIEPGLTRFFKKTEHPESTMLLVAGTGFVIAAVAGWMGFSLAIGALFAGLSFSRDPDSVKFDTSFESLYELFVPFFFINIGLNTEPGALSAGVVIGLVLLVVAVLSKIIGAGAPALLNTSRSGALLIGLSMAPRAEITMIIMREGQRLGNWAVPSHLYSGMVLVSAVSCLCIPFLLSRALEHWKQH
jgi:Kef-type K+ transport system membrane component KefB